jgi:uncharacterized protein YkwD
MTVAGGDALACSPAAPSTTTLGVSSLDSLPQVVLAEVNALRQRHGLVPLRASAALADAAREHSREMARNGYFAHDSVNGFPPRTRVLHYYPAVGYRYWAVGENLAWATPVLGPPLVLRLWLQSPAHRRILLAARWRELGIGAVHVASAGGIYGGVPATILTAEFGVRR